MRPARLLPTAEILKGMHSIAQSQVSALDFMDKLKLPYD